MPNTLHRLRRGLPLAAAAIATACSGDGGRDPVAAPPSIRVTAIDSVVEAATPFALRLSGSRVDSLGGVTLAGVPVLAGLEGDSIVRGFLPIGASGPVSLEVAAWAGRTNVRATATLRRVAAPALPNEQAFVDEYLASVDSAIALATAPLPPGEEPAFDTQQLATSLRFMRDSLQRILTALPPAERTLLLNMIAQAEAQGGAGSLSMLAPALESWRSCLRWREAVECVRQVRSTLLQKRASWQARAAYGVAVTAAGVLLAGAAGAAAATGSVVAVGIGLYVGIGAAKDGASWAKTTFEDAISLPAVRFDASLGFDSRADIIGGRMRAVSLPTFEPGVAVHVPIVRATRSPLPTDTTVALVADIPPLIAGVRDYWDQLMDLVPPAARVPSPRMPTAPRRVLRELAEPGEVSIVAITERGVPAAGITGSISDVEGRVHLTLRGDAGTGKDLAIRLALDGEGAGRVETEIAVRYQAPPPCPETMRDGAGTAYPVVFLGNRCWMAENLRMPVGQLATDPVTWMNPQQYGFISSDGVAGNQPRYTFWRGNGSNAELGFFYNAYASVQACPSGWRLPTGSDVQALTTAANAAGGIGGLLAPNPAWPANWNAIATNTLGFGATPLGIRRFNSDSEVALRSGQWVTTEFYTPRSEWLAAGDEFGTLFSMWTGVRLETSFDYGPGVGTVPYVEQLYTFLSSGGSSGNQQVKGTFGAPIRCVSDPR